MSGSDEAVEATPTTQAEQLQAAAERSATTPDPGWIGFGVETGPALRHREDDFTSTVDGAAAHARMLAEDEPDWEDFRRPSNPAEY